MPPRVRLRWLLATMRLSIITLAGMARTLVAVGTSSEVFMFLTTAAAAPRSTWVASSAASAAFAAGLAGLAAGLDLPLAGADSLAGALSVLVVSVLAGAELLVWLLDCCLAGGAGAGSGGAVGAGAAALPLPVDDGSATSACTGSGL